MTYRTVIEWTPTGDSPVPASQFEHDIASYLQTIGVDGITELWLTEGKAAYTVKAICTAVGTTDATPQLPDNP